MKRILTASAILIGICAAAFAQQQPLSAEQRVGMQIGTLMIQNASQSALIEQLQAQLAAAQSRIKTLEEKYEKPAADQK